MRTTISAEGAAGAEQLVQEGITTGAPRSFKYSASVWEFGDVSLTRIEARAIEMRGPVASRPNEISCYFVESGQVAMLGTGSAAYGRGDAVVLPRWAHFHAAIRGTSRVLAVRFNVDILEGMLPERPSDYIFVRASKLAQASYAFATSLTSSDTSGSAVETYAAGQLLAEMVGGMLLDALGHVEGESETSNSMRDRARAVIAQRYSDSQLTSQMVAAEVNTSLRSLQNAFAETGTTITDVVRSHRVSAAEALLTSARYSVLTIEEIAARVGFGSAVNMRRAFQQLRKPSPSKLRASSW